MATGLLLSTMALLAPPHTAPPDWQAAANKIAPLMAGFHAESRSQNQNSVRFARALAAFGLRATYDETKQIQHPGFYLQRLDDVVPVRGARDASLVFLQYTDARPDYMPTYSAEVLFIREPKAMRAYILQSFVDRQEVRKSIDPRQAILAGNVLVFLGTYAWEGNGPRLGVAGFKHDGAKWRLAKQLVAKYESWTYSKLRTSKDGKTVLPIYIYSRTWPKHLTSGHVDANLSYLERWDFPNGKPRFDWRLRRDTAFNTLDDLYGAMRSRNSEFIKNHSVDRKIARRLLALSKHMPKEDPIMYFPKSICDPDGKTIALDNLGFWFHFARSHGRWVVSRLVPFHRPKL